MKTFLQYKKLHGSGIRQAGLISAFVTLFWVTTTGLSGAVTPMPKPVATIQFQHPEKLQKHLTQGNECIGDDFCPKNIIYYTPKQSGNKSVYEAPSLWINTAANVKAWHSKAYQNYLRDLQRFLDKPADQLKVNDDLFSSIKFFDGGMDAGSSLLDKLEVTYPGVQQVRAVIAVESQDPISGGQVVVHIFARRGQSYLLLSSPALPGYGEVPPAIIKRCARPDQLSEGYPDPRKIDDAQYTKCYLTQWKNDPALQQKAKVAAKHLIETFALKNEY